MSISTIIQACAGVYGVLPSHDFVKIISRELDEVFSGSQDALLNHYYFLVNELPGTRTTEEVALTIAKNLGFTGASASDEALKIGLKLNAVAPMQRGAETRKIIDEYETAAAAGSVVAAFRDKKAALIAAVDDPLYLGIADRTVNFGVLSAEQIRQVTDEPISVTALTLGAKAWTAQAGRNVFTGNTSAITSERTLDPLATITGGNGIDTLRLTLGADHNPAESFRLSAVERLELTNPSTLQRTFNATGSKDITMVTLFAEQGPISLTNLASAGLNITVRDQKQGDLTMRFTESSGVGTGSSDTIALTLLNVGTATAPRLKTPGIDAIVIRSMGTGLNKIALATESSDIRTVTIEGKAPLSLTAETGTLVNSVLASNHAAELTLAIQGNGLRRFEGAKAHANTFTSTQSDAVLELVAGGAADDSFKFLSSSLNAIPTLSGGGGKNTLSITGGPSKNLSPTMTNIQTLELGDISGTFNLDAKEVAGLDTLVVTTASAAIKVYNMAPRALTASLKGASTPDAKGVEIDIADALTVEVSKGDSTATITNDLKVTASQATSLDLQVQAGALYSGRLTVPKAVDVKISTAAGDASGLASGASVSAALAQGLVINSQAKSATLAATMPVLSSAQINHQGEGPMLLTFTPPSNTPELKSFVVKQSNGPLRVTTTDSEAKLFQKVEVLTIETQSGQVDIPAMPSASQVVLVGSGADSALRVPSIGSDTTPGPLSIKVSGFAGGGVFAQASKSAGPVLRSKDGIGLDLTNTKGSIAPSDSLTANTPTNKAVIFGAIHGGDGPVTVLANGAGVVGLGAVHTKSSVTIELRNADNGSVLGLGVVPDQPAITADAVQLSAQNATALGSIGAPFIVQSAPTAQKTEFLMSFQGSSEQDVMVVRGAPANSTIRVVGDLGQAPSTSQPDLFFIEPSASITAQAVTLDASGLRGPPDGLSWVVLKGTNKNDQLLGSAANDLIIFGSAGNDTASGGTGNDIFLLNLDSAYTTVNPVAGSNRFSLTNIKQITDFNLGRDMVAFAKSATSPQAFEPVLFSPRVVSTSEYSLSTAPALPANGFYKFIRGSLIGSEFVASAGGLDLLYVVGDNSLAKAAVLTGYGGASATASNQSFSGADAQFVVRVDTTGSPSSNFQFTGLIGVA